MQPNFAWAIVIWTIATPTREAPSAMKVRVLDSYGLRFWHEVLVSLRISSALTLRSTPFFDYRLPFLIALVPVPYYLLVN